MGQADCPETSPRFSIFSHGLPRNRRSTINNWRLSIGFRPHQNTRYTGKTLVTKLGLVGAIFWTCKKSCISCDPLEGQFKKRSWCRYYSRFRGLDSATPVEVLGIANVLNVNGWNFPSRYFKVTNFDPTL